METTKIMKRITMMLVVAAILTENRTAPADWKSMITIAERKRNEQGNLLPLQSYDETIRRGMSFLLDDHLKWFKGPAETISDEKGRTQMPWVYYSNLQHNGAPFPNSIDRFVSYPAFHHSLLIRTFIRYSKYSGDGRALAEAIKLADWNIAHSTPGDWAYGNLPYSTFQEKKPGGFRDKTGLMPDKAAIMALAYIDLYKATKKPRFLKAAQAIAQTLFLRQRPNGTWPFRVDPKTEKVIEEYTSSVIYAVRLFESLDKINGNSKFRDKRDRTWNWLLNGPIKTKEFRGFYEDIKANPKGRTNYDCLDTIRYLLSHRTKANGYLEMAKELNAWVEKVFLDKIKDFEPAEGIREQLQCNVVMGIHSLNWASMLREMAEASGDEKMRQRAIQTANYITYYLQPDNRIVVGFRYHQWWYSCHTGVILYLLDFVKKGRSVASIVNGTDWFDVEGRNIAAHEGDIARFNGVFYWYGSSYANNPRGKFDIADGPMWNGVQVYSSTDLKNWTYKGVALPRPENGWGELGATGRAHVIYNDKTKKYVMWYRWYLHMPASFLMVAVADHPEGPFTPLGPREMGTSNGFASDMNVFKDDDGKAYVIYCDHETEATKFTPGANGRYAVRIDSLSDDYLNSNKDGVYAFDKAVEAPSMIKYKGKYIAVGSGVHGWAGSETVCSVADSPLGKYKKQENISEKRTWNSQVADLIYLKESDTVMTLCDQWWIPDRSDINKSRYLLLLLHLDPKTGEVKMKYYEKWNPFKPLSKE